MVQKKRKIKTKQIKMKELKINYNSEVKVWDRQWKLIVALNKTWERVWIKYPTRHY